MMECVGLEEMAWMILPIYALILLALMMPLVLFIVLLWKLRHISLVKDLKDEFTTISKERQERFKRFTDRIDDMLSVWIEDKKGKK